MNRCGSELGSFGRSQRGAVLLVGLIFLVVLTVLGISGMNTATLELAQASNTQSHQEAFQAAEVGIDLSLSERRYTTLGPAVIPITPVHAGTSYTQASAQFVELTPVPDEAFSMGVQSGSIQAFHFDVVAVGRGPGNAASTHNQSFYVVGPGGQ
ncbi:MAG: PilX N-terminal domain-containing pilus assembly protein [Candidatus Rariloculaceae bacterium]